MEAAVGRRVLDEVEETTLEEILRRLRAAVPDPSAAPAAATAGPKPTHVAELDRIAARHMRDTHSPTLAVSGRALPLLYRLVSTLVSPPHRRAVLVIDADAARFDASRLACAAADLDHVYVQQCDPADAARLVAAAEPFMLYHAAARHSRARLWWGTVVVVGPGSGPGLGPVADVVAAAAGWKGWLRVDRGRVQPLALGVGPEEALAAREARQQAVDAVGWAVTSPWGGFVFHDG